MLFGNDRQQYRRVFQEAWRKHRERLPLEPMEDMIARTIADHPEYHALIEDRENLTRDYSPESGQSNPFLHLSLHIAIQEQLAADRPAGIRRLYQQLLQHHTDAHEVEHRMLECLAETVWEAQRNNKAPDESAYLERVRKL